MVLGFEFWVLSCQLLHHTWNGFIIFSFVFRIDKDICIKKNPIFHEARLLSIS